jgi:hypothetical protein
MLELSFVAEYLIDLNAAAAYRRAGYKSKGEAAGFSEKSAATQGGEIV